MDVWEYFQSREKECGELSLVPDEPFSTMCSEENGSEGQRGIFWGRLILTEDAFLNVFEVVQVRGSGIHRERYSYYLVINGYEVWGYDRDPSHYPATHRHAGICHMRYPCRRMSFKEVANLAWETVSEEERLVDAPSGAEPLD